MDSAFKLVLQCLVHQAVAGYEHLVLEPITDNDDLEMRLGAIRHIMHVALIYDLKMLRRQGLFEFAGNGLLHVHCSILSRKNA